MLGAAATAATLAAQRSAVEACVSEGRVAPSACGKGWSRPGRVGGEQLGLGVDRPLIGVALDAPIAAVRQQLPGLGVVAQAEIQVPQDPLPVRLALDREGDLHAAEEVALH